MKRTAKLITLGVLVACAITLVTIALAQITATEEHRVTHIADIPEYPGYVVTDLEGYVAVFYKGRGYPLYITHTPIATLRGLDRAEIERGILVESRQALVELLEDLGS